MVSARPPPSGAHPRSRGENHEGTEIVGFIVGSSPLTRGKLHLAATQRASRGLIPAHAGKTDTPFARAVTHAAHPRSRGENAVAQVTGGSQPGSSPLTRGKQGRRGRGPHPLGLIPAHAGKTPGRHTLLGTCRAHPRSRGENADARSLAMPQAGSSPLTRGKRRTDVLTCAPARLIPAHAGKTSRRTRPREKWWAHPRSRGENREPTQTLQHTCGSSPLTRGKRGRDSGGRRHGGLIPAHAGKTPAPGRRCLIRRAHPRSRGENAAACVVAAARGGSSPLTRGKRVASGIGLAYCGLIPAHAGKTGCVRARLS